MSRGDRDEFPDPLECDDDSDYWEEKMQDCGQDDEGFCSLLGSEYCDFECPFRDELFKEPPMSDSRASDLLPCPLCGYEAEIGVDEQPGTYRTIHCMSCSAQAGEQHWNDRTELALIAQQRQEIEALKRERDEWRTRRDVACDTLDRAKAERAALREQMEWLQRQHRSAVRVNEEYEADNAALRDKLRAIERAAEDATEYVLAMLLREQKEENATLRTRVEALEAEVESGWTHAKHVAERDALRAQVEALRESLKSEADYCYGWAKHYAVENPERAARHRERGDRLSAALQGEQDDRRVQEIRDCAEQARRNRLRD